LCLPGHCYYYLVVPPLLVKSLWRRSAVNFVFLFPIPPLLLSLFSRREEFVFCIPVKWGFQGTLCTFSRHHRFVFHGNIMTCAAVALSLVSGSLNYKTHGPTGGADSTSFGWFVQVSQTFFCGWCSAPSVVLPPICQGCPFFLASSLLSLE